MVTLKPKNSEKKHFWPGAAKNYLWTLLVHITHCLAHSRYVSVRGIG